MRKIVALGVIAFAVTMGVLVGYRLSEEAMAVVVGTVCGVGASLPMSGLILWLTQRRREKEKERLRGWREERPSVVVINPGAANMPGLQGWPPYYPMLPPEGAEVTAGRRFTIIGEEE